MPGKFHSPSKSAGEAPGVGDWLKNLFGQKPSTEQMMRQFAIVETFPLQHDGRPCNEFHKEAIAGSWTSFEFKVSNLTQIPWDAQAMIRSDYRFPDGSYSEFKFKKVT